MDFYGINMEGPFHGERVLTLPVWTSDDEGREIYTLDTEKKYYGTSTGWVQYTGSDEVVFRSDFDANTILKADADDTPITLKVDENTIVGRISGGVIDDLTPTQVRTIINVENGADVTDYDNVSLAGTVMKVDFDANTILKADADNVPIKLDVAQNRIIGRYGSGVIDDLTPTEVRDILNVEDGADVTDYDNVSTAGAVMNVDFNANTILKADADDTPIKLTINVNEIVGRISGGVIDSLSAAQVRTIINVEDNADVTDYDNVSLAGAVMKTDFDANTILKADADNTPITLTVAEDRIVGRISGGVIDDLTPTQVRSIINVEDGADVTDAVNIASSVHGVAEKTVLADDDEFALTDSASSYVLKKIPWGDLYNLFQTRLYLNKVTKTDDYSVLTTDTNTIVELGLSTSDNKTFTLPSVGSSNDGDIYVFLNNSGYKLTIATSDTDSIWNSGAEYGIEMLDRGTLVALRYDHTNTKFDIIHKTGGRVIVEGLKLHVPMNRLFNFDPSDVYYECDEISGLHFGESVGLYILDESYSKFPPSCYDFDGLDDYIKFVDSTDWDVFGSQTGIKTISGWVYNETVTRSYDYWICHYEDGNNYWMISTSSTGYPRMEYKSDSTSYIDGSSSTQIIADTWTHIALVINGSDVGLYVDGVQVVYDGSWSADSFSGNLYIGNFSGGSSNFSGGSRTFYGKMQDWFLAYNNIFEASPNVGLTDTFDVPNKAMKLTM
jgi:hypothetical protein